MPVTDYTADAAGWMRQAVEDAAAQGFDGDQIIHGALLLLSGFIRGSDIPHAAYGEIVATLTEMALGEFEEDEEVH